MALPPCVRAWRSSEPNRSREMKVDRFGGRGPDPRITSGGPPLIVDRCYNDGLGGRSGNRVEEAAARRAPTRSLRDLIGYSAHP